MVANYFAAIGSINPNKNQRSPAAPPADDADSDEKLGPITRSLIGILKAPPGQAQVSEDDYHAYLERKYLGLDSTSQTGSPS